ncbi:MAG: TVP38/TMEM64 family protein [Planctomycetaceae bacterium]|nr:TVP38/TMEM64 family protein [Planctomycetaceae bacterium]
MLPEANRGLLRVLEAIQSAGPWGPLLMIVVYIVACVLFVPGSILTIGAGFIFGIPLGVATVSIGSTLGAGAAFVLSRTMLRNFVQRKLARDPRVHALSEAVGEHGFKIVLLARLSPLLPFNLLNFAFALTRVSFRDYMLASWIGMLPGALLYVYIGTAAKSLTDLARGAGPTTPMTTVLFGLGLAATVALTMVLTRLARRSLRELTRGRPDRLSELSNQRVA